MSIDDDREGRYLRILILWCAVITAVIVASAFYQELKRRRWATTPADPAAYYYLRGFRRE
jgi:hypothetical protein